jgi:hypothetical protein
METRLMIGEARTRTVKVGLEMVTTLKTKCYLKNN